MTGQQTARRLIVKYRNPAPDETIVAESFNQGSREAQVVGNVIRGWLGAELRRRRFAREFPQLAGLLASARPAWSGAESRRL